MGMLRWFSALGLMGMLHVPLQAADFDGPDLALSLDGATTCAQFELPYCIHEGFEVTVRFQRRTSGAYHHLVAHPLGTAGNNSFVLYMGPTDDKLYAHTSEGVSGIISGGTVKLNQWHTARLRRTYSETALFLDGQVVATKSNLPPLEYNSQHPVYIGADDNQSNGTPEARLNGLIDYVEFRGRYSCSKDDAKADSELLNDSYWAGLPQSLWKFNGNGRVYPAGNQLGNATFIGSPTFVPDGDSTAGIVYTADFTAGTNGWVARQGEGFSTVRLENAYGQLGISPGGRTGAFGWWESPRISVRPGTALEIRWRVTSNSDQEHTPSFRLRVNDGNYQHALVHVVESTGAGSNSPGFNGRIYTMYYLVPESADNISLSFDLLSFLAADDLNSWVYLNRVEVEEL